MKNKKFSIADAEHLYVTSKAKISYRKIAEEFGVDQSTISKYGKNLNWVKKRKDFQAKVTQSAINNTAQVEAHKIKILQSTTNKAIDIVNEFIEEFQKVEHDKKYIDLKDCVAILKELKGLSFELYGKLTPKEEASISIAREKLQLERERLGVNEADEKETGIVEIPAILPEPTENIVVEGESNA